MCYYCNKPGHIRPNWKQCADDQHNGIFCKNTKGSNVRTGVVNVATVANPSPSTAPIVGNITASTSLSWNVSVPSKAYSFITANPSATSNAEGKAEVGFDDDDDYGFIFMMANGLKEGEWIIDSDASHHLCKDVDSMSKMTDQWKCTFLEIYTQMCCGGEEGDERNVEGGAGGVAHKQERSCGWGWWRGREWKSWV